MKKLLIILILSYLPLIGYSQDYQSQNYALAKKKTDVLINRFLKEANIPGISVAISKDDKLIYSNSFGFSDLEHKSPATNNTKFRIASVTKLLTAVATVKLIESGIIQKDDSLQKYFNDLPEAYQKITVAQLAGHLSGIRHYTEEEIFSSNTKNYSNLRDVFEKFINDTLLFAPGYKYKYSSYGYVLLGAVLESAKKENFNDIITEYILRPAGLFNTLPEKYNVAIDNLTKFYYPQKEGDGFTIPEAENYSYKWSAGAYLSTASDLALFGSALVSGKIVDTTYLPLLFTPQKTNNGGEILCGFGFRIGTDWKGRKVVHHGGESEGSRAFFLIYPEQRLTIALLANVFRAPLFEGEAETIAGYFLNDYSWKEQIISSGKYSYTALNKDKPMKSEINIEKNYGIISNFNGRDVPIVDIVLDSDKIRIIGTARNGIINIWIYPEKNRYIGYWGYDKPKNEFIIIDFVKEKNTENK